MDSLEDVYDLSSPVVGSHSFYLRTVLSGVPRHWRYPLASGGHPSLGFKPLQRGWVYRLAPEAPRKGKCRRGPKHFWNCLTRMGSGPATGSTLYGLVPHSYAGGV